MFVDKKLPSRIKKDNQKSSLVLVVANLLLLGSIGVGFYSAFMSALVESWGQAASSLALTSLLTWLFCPHIALNSIEILINTTRMDRNSPIIDAYVSTVIRVLTAFRMHNSLAFPSILTRLGQARIHQGFYESAENLFRHAITCLDKIPSEQGGIYMSMLLLNLGSAFAWQKKYLEAEIEAEKALEILNKIGTPLSKNFDGFCGLLIGSCRVWLNELDHAEAYLCSSLESFERMEQSNAISLHHIKQGIVSCYLYLALVKLRQDNAEECHQYENKFFELVEEDSENLTTTQTPALNALADEHIRRKNFTHAGDLLNVAYALNRERPFHPDALETVSHYEKLLVATNRQSEVADMRSWLRPSKAFY